MSNSFKLTIVFWLLTIASLSFADGNDNKVGTYPIDIESLNYKVIPGIDGVKTAIVYGDPKDSGLFTTHAMVKHGSRIPPHRHPIDITTWVTSGTAYVGIGEVFDEEKLVAYSTGTYFVTKADSPHFIYAKGGDFSVLDHGSGPNAFEIVKNQ